MKNSFPRIPTSAKYFYIAAKAILELLSKHLGLFSAFNASYTDKYVTNLRNTLDNTYAIPASKTSIGKRKQSRIDLKNSAIAVREKFQVLKRIIERSFPADSVKTQLEIAGWNNFMEPSENWGYIKQGGESALKYIVANESVLKAKGNMPDTFQQEFGDLYADFNVKLDVYSIMTQEKVDAVVTKNKANSEVYEQIIGICKDAVVVLQKDKELKTQFSFAYQVALLSGGAASLKGYLTDAAGLPLEGVKIGDARYSAVTDNKGYFRITRMAEGEYTFKIWKDGFMTVAEHVVLKASTSKTIRVQLPVPMQAVA